MRVSPYAEVKENHNFKSHSFAFTNGRRMWGVVAAWVVCLASLSLPWPGVTLVVLLCCVAVFELASPTAWVAAAAARRTGGANKPPAATVPNLEEMTTDQGRKNGSNSSGAVAAPSSDAGVPPSRRTPSAALAGVVRFLTERLRLGGRDGGEMEEVGMTAAVGSGGGGVANGADGEGDATQQERQSKSRSQVQHTPSKRASTSSAACLFVVSLPVPRKLRTSESIRHIVRNNPMGWTLLCSWCGTCFPKNGPTSNDACIGTTAFVARALGFQRLSCCSRGKSP